MRVKESGLVYLTLFSVPHTKIFLVLKQQHCVVTSLKEGGMRVHGNCTKITTSSSESCVVNDSWLDPGRGERTIRSPDTCERLLSNTGKTVLSS